MSGGAAKTVGLIGARGFTGREFLGLLARHPSLDLAFAVSRSNAGAPVRESAPDWPGDEVFEDLTPEEAAARGADAIILATPNGETGPWAHAIEKAAPKTVILDISADHRFEDAWTYGLPELGFRDALKAATRIANPGCYATALQLAAAPLKEILAGPPHAFAISGWSGAGSSPNPRNDPERLAENVMPYKGVGHIHEREASRHLGFEARLSPHVAPFFRGITLTLAAEVRAPVTVAEVGALYAEAYGREPLIRLLDREAEVRDAALTPDAAVGAATIAEDGLRLTVTCAIDNLLKGAASQAMQNVNLALGFPERAGLEEGA